MKEEIKMGSLLYDGIVIGVLALFAWRGWKKGLLLSLCGLLVALFAFWGAGFLADTLDDPVANAMEPKLAAAIENNISDYMAPHYDDLTPADPMDGLRDMGGIYEWVADALAETRETMDSVVLDTVQGVAHAAARAIAVQIAHTVIFAVAFVLLFVLLTLLLHALNLVAKLPGLHFCNGLGGGVIGLVKGGLIVFVAVGVATLMFSTYLPDTQTLERSYIFKFFVENNPIISLFAG